MTTFDPPMILVVPVAIMICVRRLLPSLFRRSRALRILDALVNVAFFGSLAVWGYNQGGRARVITCALVSLAGRAAPYLWWKGRRTNAAPPTEAQP